MAEFKVKVDSVWSKPDDFKVLLTEESDEEVEEDDEGVEIGDAADSDEELMDDEDVQEIDDDDDE
jgi:hypothetical protein